MIKPVERPRSQLPLWVGRWFPTVVTLLAVGAVVFSMVGGWPNFERPPGYVVTSGFIVAIEPKSDDAGEDADTRVQYGFVGPENKNFFSTAIIGEGGVLPGYGWEKLSNSEPIKVAYYPLQPDQNIPYRAFPLWALAAWAGLAGSIAVSVALWIKNRLFPKPDEAEAVPDSTE